MPPTPSPLLSAGDPAPWFTAATSANPTFQFDTVAGRYVVLCFFGSSGDPRARAELDALVAEPELYDDRRLAVFGVSADPGDRERLEDATPAFLRIFWDADGALSRRYGALASGARGLDGYRAHTLVLDPTLRVMLSVPFGEPGHAAAVLGYLRRLPPPDSHAGTASLTAPALVVPRVFEPDFCRRLIGLYEANGGQPSGFMREVDGKTVSLADTSFKRRSDHLIDDPEVRAQARDRIERRVLPEVRKAFQFNATRIERYIVACYDAASGGFFRAHRDNTTKGTAHRRFAVTMNLNAEEFEGGELRFPEFGSATYKAPTGGVVVFSCSLLHEARPVVKGTRYAFLPFLYDEEGARVRERNNAFLGAGVGAYGAKGKPPSPPPGRPPAARRGGHGRPAR